VPAALGLDLARTAVFLDFDGTVTTRDSGVEVLERLAPPEWRALSEAYARDEIGSRECLLDEWALVPKDEAAVRAVAREVGIDPGFVPLVERLRSAGAEVTVVSDGFGFYAEEVCAAAGVPLLTNSVDWATGELVFPHENRCCPCSTCGVCKQAPIKDARYAGKTAVLVGDGTSDRKAALLADVVLAKGNLARWCAGTDVAYVPFTTLADVEAALAS
jgi:2-hydroxy-3-keto-5-methylthiopentenyl-1-phosphate phosphatase